LINVTKNIPCPNVKLVAHLFYVINFTITDSILGRVEFDHDL